MQQFARGYSIPIGMPSNCISGILVSREVAQNQEKLAVIKQYFPDKYITTPDGELIYEPQRAETKKEEQTSIADAMRDLQTEPKDAFAQELGDYFRNNPDMDVDTLSEYINGLVDKVYKEFEDTTRTEDVNARIERFNKRISTIRRNANFQRLAMSNDKGKELYGKIASLIETDIEEPGATDAKLGKEHQNETYLKRRDLEIRLKGLGYRMSSYDSNVSLEQALITEKLLQQISIKHPSFLKLELGEMNGEELAFAQNELSRLGFNSQVPNQYEGTAFVQRIPLVMKKRSRDEITMCSQGIGLGRQEINGVTQETREIITQEATKTNDGVSITVMTAPNQHSEIRVRGASQLQNLINEKQKLDETQAKDKERIIKFPKITEIKAFSTEFCKIAGLPRAEEITDDFLEQLMRADLAERERTGGRIENYAYTCLKYMQDIGIPIDVKNQTWEEFFAGLSEEDYDKIKNIPNLEAAIMKQDKEYELGATFGQTTRIIKHINFCI